MLNKVILISSVFLSVNVFGVGFTNNDLRQNLPFVVKKARAIVKSAEAKKNPYARKLLKMLNLNRIRFSNESSVLAEYVGENRLIYIHRVPEENFAFERDFMLNQYYPAILIHEAVHDLVRTNLNSEKSIKQLHGKKFAEVCASIFKSAGINFVLRDGWSRGFDFHVSKYLDFQVELTRENSPYKIVTTINNMSELHLRRGINFNYLGQTFTAGNNVVLHVNDLHQLSYDESESKIVFSGKVEKIRPHYNGLPLDVTIKKNATLELQNGVILRANRDSFIRMFILDKEGVLQGVNVFRSFPGKIDASFSTDSLNDIAGIYIYNKSLKSNEIMIENTNTTNSISISPDKVIILEEVQGTILVNEKEITCTGQSAVGDFEENRCLIQPEGKRKLIITNSINSDKVIKL